SVRSPTPSRVAPPHPSPPASPIRAPARTRPAASPTRWADRPPARRLRTVHPHHSPAPHAGGGGGRAEPVADPPGRGPAHRAPVGARRGRVASGRADPGHGQLPPARPQARLPVAAQPPPDAPAP